MKLSNSIFALSLLLSFQTNTMYRLSRIYKAHLGLSLSNSFSSPLRLNAPRMPVNYFSSNCKNCNRFDQCNLEKVKKYINEKEFTKVSEEELKILLNSCCNMCWRKSERMANQKLNTNFSANKENDKISADRNNNDDDDDDLAGSPGLR